MVAIMLIYNGFSAYMLYAVESKTLMVAKNNKKH